MSPSSSIIIQAETLQSNEVIIPQLYNGAYISVQDAECLLKRPGRNGQVNNLVYCKDQLPDDDLHKAKLQDCDSGSKWWWWLQYYCW
eukprot:jgi/Psemu1/10972/gm1.10972_g